MATSTKSFLALRIQKKCRIANNATAYTLRCSICQRATPIARTARFTDVAAMGNSSSQAKNPTKIKGRLAMSAAMSGRSQPMSNQA